MHFNLNNINSFQRIIPQFVNFIQKNKLGNKLGNKIDAIIKETQIQANKQNKKLQKRVINIVKNKPLPIQKQKQKRKHDVKANQNNVKVKPVIHHQKPEKVKNHKIKNDPMHVKKHENKIKVNKFTPVKNTAHATNAFAKKSNIINKVSPQSIQKPIHQPIQQPIIKNDAVINNKKNDSNLPKIDIQIPSIPSVPSSPSTPSVPLITSTPVPSSITSTPFIKPVSLPVDLELSLPDLTDSLIEDINSLNVSHIVTPMLQDLKIDSLIDHLQDPFFQSTIGIFDSIKLDNRKVEELDTSIPLIEELDISTPLMGELNISIPLVEELPEDEIGNNSDADFDLNNILKDSIPGDSVERISEIIRKLNMFESQLLLDNNDINLNQSNKLNDSLGLSSSVDLNNSVHSIDMDSMNSMDSSSLDDLDLLIAELNGSNNNNLDLKQLLDDMEMDEQDFSGVLSEVLNDSGVLKNQETEDGELESFSAMLDRLNALENDVNKTFTFEEVTIEELENCFEDLENLSNQIFENTISTDDLIQINDNLNFLIIKIQNDNSISQDLLDKLEGLKALFEKFINIDNNLEQEDFTLFALQLESAKEEIEKITVLHRNHSAGKSSNSSYNIGEDFLSDKNLHA